MNPIKPEWINDFFHNNEDFYTDLDEKGNVTYIDGHLSIHALANFLTRKAEEEEKK